MSNAPAYYFLVIHKLQNGLKTSVDPCNDFYEYGCGNWRKNNPIPEGYVRWTTFKQIQYEIFHRVHDLLINGFEKDELPLTKIAKQYHQSCMNEEAIEYMGLKPIKIMLKATGEWPILNRLNLWYKKQYTWQYTYSTYNELYGFSNIFRLVYKQDEQDKTRNVFLITHRSDENKQLLKDTCRHINYYTMLRVLRAFAVDQGMYFHIKKLNANLKDIINFERKVGKLTSKGKLTRMTIEELQYFYNSFTTGKLSINWLDVIKASFQGINLIINASEVVIVNKEFFRELALLFDVTPQHIIVNYLQWNMVCRLMKYLNKQMRNIESECYSNCDAAQRAPRWLTCVQDIWIEHLTSYLYVKTYISADVLKAVSKMVDEIKAQMKERISLSPRLSGNKKNYMIDKLEKILSYIGYSKWYSNETAFIEHYKGLELGNIYFENILAIAKHERKKFYTTVKNSNRDSYSRTMYPSTRAKDVSLQNIIVLPAALMRDPFFTFNRPSALNYGAIGFIIGHQLAHSLDLGEPEINDHQIWIFANRFVFTETWKCLIDSFHNKTQGDTDDYGKPITFGNTALKEYSVDIIGVQAAFAAFNKSKAKDESSNLWSVQNITDDQLFFLSFANIMCTSTKARNNVEKFSGHFDEKFRVIVSLLNTESFSEAFECELDSPMNPISKCKLWEYP